MMTRLLRWSPTGDSDIEQLENFLSVAAAFVWGVPTVVLLTVSGLGLSLIIGGIRGGIQAKAFFHGIAVLRGKYDDPNDPGEITHFQALSTALSATIGLGNIGIVPIIIKYGGPGAIFWMIVAGAIGMGTKYAECTLAMVHRKIDKDGTVSGGPMYYMEFGLGPKFKPMAQFYAVAITVGSFGISNMFQTNQSATILHQSFQIPHWITGAVLMVCTAMVILGGIKRIAKVTSFLVPLMAISYVLGCLVVIGSNFEKLPDIFYSIVHGAFNGSALAGGAFGSFQLALLHGVKRACFSNEAGLGSAAIAHAAATTSEPAREGVVALLGPFIDTIVICTMTAIAILATGVWETSDLVGVPLTATAFDTVISGFGYYFIPIAATLFAFSTLISWSYYGEVAVKYLGGPKLIAPYKILFCIMALLGALWKIQSVLDFSDFMIGLMVVPNMITLWLLLHQIKEQTRIYFEKMENFK